ncbi:helicase-exonuclease AddAB subunit AddA [Lentibacillus amyloliquefaciens]|uniref:ATP-dependent helicase/nuclease subunit A n=1 Tax=Lentibacillus amyloliquefaciens TaxID=1472767 RepID=A0A0U4FS18_9BACI|nr:helicase-exonuclease AddAB subunit AddA [Lentibacillus amyloliquefaciens]ALX48677.1 ATP-dependent helicase [Lentibacillus amyloliquefaciens]
MVNWTREQEEAIYTDGRDVLVAAAAGSGKTAVLVERIIQKLVRNENPVDIDSLLVVTFTNAAAQEMRNRVAEALEERLAENPASMHLKKQLSLLQRASISTLHSFCLDIVRQYAYLLDIDPGFRIADDMEADLIKQEVSDNLLEEWYGKEGAEQENFFSVVDRFSSDRSDADVEDLIFKLYNFAMQNPRPAKWLEELADAYDIPDNWQEDDLNWLDIIKQEVQNQFDAIHQQMHLAMELTRENDGPYHYADTIESDFELLHEAQARKSSWKDLQAFMTSRSFDRLSGKSVDCDKTKQEYAKTLRKNYKDRWEKMKDNWFSRDLENHVADMQTLAPVIRQLAELVKQFKDRFSEEKRERGIVDFSDLEHFCLELLMDESSDEANVIPSNVTVSLREQFTELLIDEYQDTNLVQETILSLISDSSGPGNRFMVGDVKQSIYRFRHAEPSLFIDKYKRFANEELAAKRIDLASNFRSREQILTGTNYVFRQILDEALGEISYDKDAELIYANNRYDALPHPEPEPELVIIDRESPEEKEDLSPEEEDYQDLEKAQLEARAYAEKIKGWIGKKEAAPLQVYDKTTDAQRDMQYRDVVILLRSMTWAPAIMDELKKQGIPVYAELSTGYFEAMEVKIMINLLKVIDNPRQDIPLASVLKSPIVGLNEEELGRVRLADRHGGYYDALKAFHKQNRDDTAIKTGDFLENLERYRVASRQGALSELIWQIYRETGYYDFVGGMPGGRQRQANLRALYDRARGYETTSFRGLFRFLRFIERMEERGDDLGAARALSEQEDVVRIMTIHKSKGLEFPVVILGAMDKQFNLQDLNARYLLHKDLGFASKFIDPVKRIMYPTLFYHALKEKKRRESLAEEMRVLYVALTRAKEKLLMIGNVSSFTKKQEKWEQIINHTDWVLPAHYRVSSKTYLDWIGPALIRHQSGETLRSMELSDQVLEAIRLDPSEWNVSVVHGSYYANLDEELARESNELKENIVNWEALELDDNIYHQAVDNRLSYVYPYEEAAHSRAKQTVTEIKRQREIKDEYSDDQLVQTYRPPIIKRPAFMQKQQSITAAERGTAMHTVMQHIPLDKPMPGNAIEEFVESLVEREILTRQEADAIDILAVEAFFTTDFGQMVINAPVIYREVPFSLTLPASEIYAKWTSETDERVLVQGVIDCVMPKDDGWIILDYKTDAITGEVTEDKKGDLSRRYDVQMKLYKQALESIWKESVATAHLYFFDRQLELKI